MLDIPVAPKINAVRFILDSLIKKLFFSSSKKEKEEKRDKCIKKKLLF